MKHLIILFALVSIGINTHAQQNLMDPGPPEDYYNLVVETETVVLDSCWMESENVGEVLVHRFYVEAQDSNDKLTSVFGLESEDYQYPLVINAPGGVYNHPLTYTWNASGINPDLVDAGFCMNYDSYATITLDGPAYEVPGAEDPSLVQDYLLSPSVSGFFSQNTLGEPAELAVNTFTGASWYVWNPASNSLPDEDGRWLVMQLTSAAHVDGVLNFLIFPLGVDGGQIQITRPFNTALRCTDPYACNYEPSDFHDPGICDYSCCPGPGCCGEGTTWDSASQTCLTTFLHDADFDGCVGMSDLLSLLSVFGSCQSNYSSGGCTNPLACNYDLEAVIDDGSCDVPIEYCEWCVDGESVLINDADGDGIADDDCNAAGCIDSSACNFDPAAMDDDGSCTYPAEFNDCDGNCLNDTNNNGFCDEIDPWLFQCGNLWNFQGYNYVTVQIGEQCWFAENLRSEHYDNGDEIPAGLSDSEWESTSSGAVAVYDQDASNLESYGRLYNWHAVDDARGLCPSGWHVPSDGEWMTLEMALGMSESDADDTGWRGTDQGIQMKTAYGWSGGGNGTNSSGFSGLPGGYRLSDGFFSYAGNRGFWWSSSPIGSYAWSRGLFDVNGKVYRDFDNLQNGFSVRCVRDAE